MFCHGTKRGFTKGGYLFPASFHGGETRPGSNTENADWVYVTDDYELAEWYAVNSKGSGKPKVLTVEVMGELVKDDSPYDNEHNQYRSHGIAKVINVVIVE